MHVFQTSIPSPRSKELCRDFISKALRYVCYFAALTSILWFISPIIGITRGTMDGIGVIMSLAAFVFFAVVAGIFYVLSRLKFESRASQVVRGIMWCAGLIVTAASLWMILAFIFIVV